MRKLIAIVLAFFTTQTFAQSSFLKSKITSMQDPLTVASGTAGGGGGMGIIAADELTMRVDYLGQFGELDILKTDATSLAKLNGIEDPRIVLMMRNRIIKAQIVDSTSPDQVSITTDDGKQIMVVKTTSDSEAEHSTESLPVE